MSVAQTSYSDFLPVGHQLDQFRIEGLLGQGGFSKVYRATDTAALQRTVAIKEYLPTDIAVRDSTTVHPRAQDQETIYRWGLRRFLAEARLIAQVDHPNVVRILKVFEANNTAYFAMPFERGMNLKNFLQKRSSLTEAELQHILLPLLDALAKLHQRGIFHRDIKPQNIIIRQGMVPLLIDFGAARSVLSQQSRTLPIYTSGYSPFEQYGHDDGVEIGPYTDIYALGATCYVLIGARKPMDAMTRMLTRSQHQDPLTPAREVGAGRYSEALLKAIDWALAIAPNDRPQSVAEWLSQFPEQQRLQLDLAAELALEATFQEPEPAPSEATPPPTGSTSHTTHTPRPRVALDSLLALLARLPRLPSPPSSAWLNRLGPRYWVPGLAVVLGLVLTPWLLPGGDEATEVSLDPIAQTPETTGDTTDSSPLPPPLPPELADLLVRAREARQTGFQNNDAATELYREALDIDPDNAEALAGLQAIADESLEFARGWYRSGHSSLARKFIQEGLSAKPDHSELLALQARLERESDPR